MGTMPNPSIKDEKSGYSGLTKGKLIGKLPNH
jgi:hypothetical protein